MWLHRDRIFSRDATGNGIYDIGRKNGDTFLSDIFPGSFAEKGIEGTGNGISNVHVHFVCYNKMQ